MIMKYMYIIYNIIWIYEFNDVLDLGAMISCPCRAVTAASAAAVPSDPQPSGQRLIPWGSAAVHCSARRNCQSTPTLSGCVRSTAGCSCDSCYDAPVAMEIDGNPGFFWGKWWQMVYIVKWFKMTNTFLAKSLGSQSVDAARANWSLLTSWICW